MLLNLRTRLWGELARLLWSLHEWSGHKAQLASDHRFTAASRALDRKYGF